MGTHDAEQPSQEGQVSEVGGLAGAGEEIMPDQSVAGAPDADSGRADEGGTGPNARPRHNHPDDDEPTQEPDA